MARPWHDAACGGRRATSRFLALCLGDRSEPVPRGRRARASPCTWPAPRSRSSRPTSRSLLLGVLLRRAAARQRLAAAARARRSRSQRRLSRRWLLLSSALNGFTPLVGAAKLLEYGVLGARRRALPPAARAALGFVALLVAVTRASPTCTRSRRLRGVTLPAARQDSFTRRARPRRARDRCRSCSRSPRCSRREHRLGRLPLVGRDRRLGIGVVLGAALAEPPRPVPRRRGDRRARRRRAAPRRHAARVVIDAGRDSSSSRPARSRSAPASSGFLTRRSARREAARTPGQYAASWSQRLIYAYIGGRVFLDNPVLGTGWYGELPPKEYARFLADAKRTLPRPAAELLPDARTSLHPAADLRPGAVRARDRRRRCCSSSSACVTVRTAVRVGRTWPRGEPDETARLLTGGLDGVADRRRWRARRCSAGSRSPRSSGSRSARRPRAVADPSTARARGAVSERDDRARDRATQRRRRRAACDRARRRAARRGHDVLVVAGTLAEGEESMEYGADELGVRCSGCPSCSASSRRARTRRRSASCAA